MTTKPKPKITPRKPGTRTVVPDRAALALETRLASRENPAKRVESSQARTTAPRQAPPAEPSPGAEDRAVVRKRGAWTKDLPYQRKDGTATRSTTVYLPVELAERLRRYAFERDTKQNAIVTDAIEAYLDARGA